MLFLIFQTLILQIKAEIDGKDSRPKVSRNKFNHVKFELQIILNFIDFTHICSLFLISNDRSLDKHDKIKQNKFSELRQEYPLETTQKKFVLNYPRSLSVKVKNRFDLKV